MRISKDFIEEIITEASHPVTLDDLRRLQKDYLNWLQSDSIGQIYIDLGEDLTSISVEEPGVCPSRIVVIGDIHCDFSSIAGLLKKLCLSDYDYFNKGVFVFLGDYVDRGSSPFQTLRLLLNLKMLLGRRCIMLRGNHDSFYFSEEERRFKSPVSPSDTIDFFQEYLDAQTIRAFSEFFEKLPYYATLDRNGKRYLLVHGSIPRDDLIAFFDPGSFVNIQVPIASANRENVQTGRCLNSMLWGDPVDVEFKYSLGLTRFEFGSSQFEEFMSQHGFTHLVRGHEPKLNGYEAMFNNRLITIFSTGGEGNEDSYYQDSVPNPAVGIIDENGDLRPESIFASRVTINFENEGDLAYDDNIMYYYAMEPDKPYRIASDFRMKGLKDIKISDLERGIKYYLHPEFGTKLEVVHKGKTLPAFIHKALNFLKNHEYDE